MAKKHFSVIIIPHSKTSHKTLSVSHKTVRAVIAGSGLFVVLLAFVLVDYASMSILRHKFRSLEKETVAQREKIAGYETSINRLKATITRFEDFAKKLNVMAGLKSPDVISDPAGLGGGEGPAAAAPAPASGPQVAPAAAQALPPVLSPATIQTLADKAQNVESNLNTLVNFWEGQTLLLASTPTIMPAQGYLVSDFGFRVDPFTGQQKMHYGVDVTTQMGNPVVATASGIVLTVKEDKFLGKHVILSHGYGFTTIYGHLSAFKVRAGQKVKRGDLVGLIGMTGKAVGPHVHYEVRIDGKPVNPYRYLLEEN